MSKFISSELESNSDSGTELMAKLKSGSNSEWNIYYFYYKPTNVTKNWSFIIIIIIIVMTMIMIIMIIMIIVIIINSQTLLKINHSLSSLLLLLP